MGWGLLLCSTPPRQGTVDQPHYVKMFSQGVMSSTEARKSPGFCPVKGQKSGLSSRTRVRNQFSSLSLRTDKTPPHYRMLFVYPAFYPSTYILPWDPQGRFRSNKLVNSSPSCELVGYFISTYPRMSRDSEHSHRTPGGNVIKRLWALLYQWGRCSGGLKSSQNRLAVRANTNTFFCFNVHKNFICTGQDGI
jgi:hypothetical protein